MSRNEPVAIVGMACRFPGGDGLEGFRQLLWSGSDAVEEGEPGSGKGRIGELFEEARPRPDPRRFGAFVKGVDRFDAAFFGIPDREARLMDPQHRLLLEVSWRALEHAGIAPGDLAGSRTGVFAGVGDSGYRELLPADEAASIYAAVGNIASTAIGRISYALGLEGPALALDTASSSSLVAVHQAVVALQRGEADLVLAGGVNLILSPTRTEMFANGGMLAGDGRCRSFAAAAQGYVRGEGCGIVVLQLLSTAEQAGRRILGVVRGSAVNQDGRSAGLTAPSGVAQERLIENALGRAGWQPSAVDYLEGHGSGTPLGDPIEVEAALRVYGRGRSSKRPLLLGSVKSNVGHLEDAAGVAGLIKVVLALEAGVIPRQLHFDEPNPRIAWRDLPVRVVTESTSWPRRANRRMRAGVSSFGLSGTNAHVLVEGYSRPQESDAGKADDGRALVLPLSAKTPGALCQLAGQYRSWLESRGPATLRDLAWTATVGRSHFAYRAAVVFRDEEELDAGLAHVEAGESTAEAAITASPSDEPGSRQVPTLEGRSVSARGSVEDLARAWESGKSASLTALFGDSGGRLVSVPGYPFEHRQYWFDESGEADLAEEAGRSGLLGASEPISARTRRLESFLVTEAQALSRLDRPPAAEAGFLELGLESLQVVELRNRLNRLLGGAYRVSEAEMFSHPNAKRLAAHVAAQLDESLGQKTARSGKLTARRLRSSDPIVVVGMSCRFPGGGGPEDFWRCLADGKDLVTHGRAGGELLGLGERESKLWGAYLPELDRFDADFFRIAPVEAELMDPQQRLLLEVSWEALEDAGIAPGSLKGSRTGVYAGIFASDYQGMVSKTAPGLYRSTGTSFSAAIGRVAYTLGLEGPAIAVDTACSSSLVAIHQAVTALEREEIDLALAGGVNVILTAGLTDAFEAAGMLSPGGRCKTFDSSADGYVRGEGCGMLALMHLSRARAGGHQVLGLILGSAVNQDGASAGLTAPNGRAQERLIGDALARAGIEPFSVDYLEAHGTGTPLGDPIELQAAAAAYGPGRKPERPLLVGSVKTNIGHLEAAAGVAGVIKVLLAIRQGLIPRHLHLAEPSPRVDWKHLPLSVVTEAVPWPSGPACPRRAAVSSFGYSGTNAHIVLEGNLEDYRTSPVISEPPFLGGFLPPQVGETRIAERVCRLLPLSARTSEAVRELARRYGRWLDNTEGSATRLADAAWTATVGRSHFDHRATVVFRDAASLQAGLRKISEATDGVASGRGQKIAFLYGGQGSQWPGMGQELYETEPVFRQVLDRCEAVFREEREGSLLAVMFGGAKGLDRTEWTQPALYALESAMTALWASVGVRPEVVFGHSVGEIAGAASAGAFELEEGMRFAARRGALMGSLPAGGAMAAVFAPRDKVEQALSGSVSLAADNGAHQVVSGPEGEVAALLEVFESDGIVSEPLRTSHAFHSALMEPALSELESAAVGASAPAIPLVSNVSGGLLAGLPDGAYWRRQAREPVAFSQSLATLAELGVGILVEIGPHAVLGPMAALAWPGTETPTVVATLHREGGGDFVSAVAAAYEAGVPLSFAGLYAGERRRRVSLPTYPFQRERHWVGRGKRSITEAAHPLLGTRRDSRSGEVSFETELFADDPTWLRDHCVFGETVAPAALYAALALEAFEDSGGRWKASQEDVQIHRPLVLFPNKGRTVQVVLSADGRWEVLGRANAGKAWELHAEGRAGAEFADGDPHDALELRECLQTVDPRELYERFAATGIAYGPAFRILTDVRLGSDAAVGELALPAEVSRDGLLAAPTLLDGCVQLLASLCQRAGAGTAWLPIGWERLSINAPLPERMVCTAHVRAAEGETCKGDLAFFSTGGEALGGAQGFTLKRASRSTLLSSRGDDLLYEQQWRECRPVGLERSPILSGPEAVAIGLRPADRYLEEHGLDRDRLLEHAEGLEREARWHTLRGLEALGWEPKEGERFDGDELRRRLSVTSDHRQLFGRLLALLEGAGVVSRDPAGDWVVTASSDRLPVEGLAAPDGPPDSAEQRLLRCCSGSLAEVLRGRADPLELFFGEDQQAADFYREWKRGAAASRMASDALRAEVSGLPEGRPLRILEVGAGTGATTAALLATLPGERTDYEFTDISTAFFRSAQARFSGSRAEMRYRPLDIEKDPTEQGFEAHRYDVVVAANVLHATQDLAETLANCRRLLAPSGLLLAIEGTAAEGWLDLTFGLLPGWWRFDDDIRTGYALLGPEAWRRALAAASFGETALVGQDLGQMLILARAPAEAIAEPGLFVLAGGGEISEDIERELQERGQAVSLGPIDGDRTAWRSFFESLPAEVPLRGVAYLAGVRADASRHTTAELRHELEEVGSGALHLVQGLTDAAVVPQGGVWFVTRGGQVVDREVAGALAGATLWGLGSVVDLECTDLNPRLVDLDPEAVTGAATLADELLFPDRETRIAWRRGRRLTARLMRSTRRVEVPEGGGWRVAPDPTGALHALQVQQVRQSDPGRGEILVAVEAAGLNFRDLMVAMQELDTGQWLGIEACGRVVAVGPSVDGLSDGDRVVGFAPGAFRPEVMTRAALVAVAPTGLTAAELATLPVAFVTSELAFQFARLERGDRVLVHAATGGVGQAAIQLAQAAGFEVHATASAPKQAVLRSLGIDAVYDSRDAGFGEKVLEATGGRGVRMVLNSLTGEGFIEAGLSCVSPGGCFVEIGKRGIWSAERVREVRPDVRYLTLAVDRLVAEEPERVGAVLREVLARVGSGELGPLPLTRWPLAEVGMALEEMRAARHVGKLVLTTSALARGGLRRDRSYLVTGGLGGIGLEIAARLAEWGAGAVVLNGRRQPDARAQARIEALRELGAEVRVKVADVTDELAVHAMLSRIEAELPSLGGIVHCAGVLSDGALANQDWGRFERVLWPKVLGAWILHRATLDRELDFFVMFSSLAGVIGNPGQANHAAANAFLDQLARHRRALGCAGQSIAWGAWADIGKAEEERDTIAGKLARFGEGWITPADGLGAFSRLLREDAATSVVAAMDWSALPSRTPFLEELVPSATRAPVPSASPGAEPEWQLEEDPEQALVRLVQEQLVAVLGLSSAPPPDMGFFELGMDSLMAVEFRNRLKRALSGKLAVSNTAVFDHPDTFRLAAHLAAQHKDSLSEDRAVTAFAETGGPVPAEFREADHIAIVGMACRFPGAPDVAAFWEQLLEGRDAVTKGRPDGLFVDPETEAARFAGAYVDGLDRFDAQFFRIAPVEAEFLDPQQRMLLEVSWAALEDSGVDPGGVRGSLTAVFGGIAGNDYQTLVARCAADPPHNLYRSTGVSASVAVGRVAFALGLMGPAVTVDTACSSSLVAVHQAAAALARGEADLALAGGANAILGVATARIFEDGGMLAADGRCKTFDASADGFVRGEGCGMVVLKRLADAEAAGDRILAVLLGSAVNQDGASAGLTVPNGVAQERVIERALAEAGVAASEVDYLEAHGTGTELGDPVEVAAAAAVYGRGRDPEHPLLIGSVKTNIGHLEGAAGIAGLIKAVLSLRAGLIPKHLHFTCPNPRLDWERLPVRVTDETTPWPAAAHRRRAAVSSFGYSGTNAHVVIEEYPEPRDAPQLAAEDSRTWRLLPLSAQTPAAVRDLAARYQAWLGDEDVPPARLADAAWTAAVGRKHFGARAGLAFSDVSGLRTQLEVLSSDENRIASGHGGTKVAFLYTGQGSQWAGMGRELYASEPVFREVLDRCDRVFQQERGMALLPVMFGASEGLDRTEWTQPALYALESALTALWTSVGVRPDVVFGHSVGEIAAAMAAGAFELEGGMRFAVRRGALMGSLPDGGAMASISAPAERVMSSLGGSVSLAADNGAHQVVSGPEEQVCALMEEFESDGIPVRRLRTSHGFHSVLMDPVIDELEVSVGQVSLPGLPFITGLSGRPLSGLPDGAYWRRQAREPVRFRSAVATLAELEVSVLVEVGPHAVLGPMARLAWQGSDVPAMVTSVRREGVGDFAAAVAAAYEAGVDVAFEGLFAGERRSKVSLPTYPFQRERYWVESGRRRGDSKDAILGVRRDLPRGESSFQLDACDFPWLRDHRVFGRVLAPVALYGAQAVAAAIRCDSTGVRSGAVVTSATRVLAPLLLSDEDLDPRGGKPGRVLQLSLCGDDGPALTEWEAFSRTPTGSWVRHAEGHVGLADSLALESLPPQQLERMKDALTLVAVRDQYLDLAERGLDYGPAFRGIARLWSGDREAVGEVESPVRSKGFDSPIHPAVLDACFQVLLAVKALDTKDTDHLWLPIGWDELRLTPLPPEQFTCHARLVDSGTDRTASDARRSFDLSLYAPDGRAVGAVAGFTLQRTARAAIAGTESIGELFYEFEWREDEPSKCLGKQEAPDSGIWLVAMAGSAATADLAENLASVLGRWSQAVMVATDSEAGGEGTFRVEPCCRQSWRSLFRGLPADIPLRGVVYLSGLEGAGARASGDEMRREVEASGASALALSQGLLDADRTPTEGIWFVTRGGQVIDRDAGGALTDAALWGFARCLAREAAALRVHLLDLDPGAPASAELLASELLRSDSETEVAWRDGRRLLARLVRRRARTQPPDGPGWRFARNPAGVLDHLPFEESPKAPLSRGEVRVAVEAAGLNYHDVMVGLGLVDQDSPLGGEFAGRVAEIGTGVDGLSAGDRVVGLASGTFGLEVVAAADLVATAPPEHSAVSLATLPVAFVTAWLAYEFAEMGQGGRVLVHAGTGGVGQAAIQLAKSAGLEVYATASAPKQEYLRALGAAAVFDSRSPAFGEEVLEKTGGSGVGMVLNSLTGDGFIEASLSCLASGGAFVELGRLGIWTPEAMEAARPDVRYCVLALDQLAKRDPARIGAALGAVLAQVGAGALTTLPHSRWSLLETAAAMEHMRAARHVGKLVLAMPALARGCLRADRSYLVTGGFGDLGLRIAGWLLKMGAGAIVLNGRRGPDPAAAEEIAKLRAEGGVIAEEIADVSDGAAVAAMLARIGNGSGLQPLGGVIHCAGTLSDATVRNQDWEAFERVLAPKAVGAWNLHRATEGMELDLFVLFSSLAGFIGNAGQANHGAANSFLDQLARHRRALGLPGQAVAWGAWSELGTAAAQGKLGRRQLEASGTGWISPDEGLEALSRVLREDAAGVMVARMDWSALKETQSAPSLLEEVLAGVRPTSVDIGLVQRLRGAGDAEARTILREFVLEEVRQLLWLPSSPSPRTGFFDMGMDSLTAVELRNRLQRAFAGEVAVSDTVALDFPNVEELAEHLAEVLRPTPDADRSSSPGEDPQANDDELLAEILTELDGDDG